MINYTILKLRTYVLTGSIKSEKSIHKKKKIFIIYTSDKRFVSKIS